MHLSVDADSMRSNAASDTILGVMDGRLMTQPCWQPCDTSYNILTQRTTCELANMSMIFYGKNIEVLCSTHSFILESRNGPVIQGIVGIDHANSTLPQLSMCSIRHFYRRPGVTDANLVD